MPALKSEVAREVLTNQIEITSGKKSGVCKDVEQNIHVLEVQHKTFKLLEILGIYHVDSLALIFVNKQEGANIPYKNGGWNWRNLNLPAFKEVNF